MANNFKRIKAGRLLFLIAAVFFLKNNALSNENFVISEIPGSLEENLYSFKPRAKIEKPDFSGGLKDKVREEIKNIASKNEAERHMVFIEVPVWRLSENGRKVSGTENIQVLNVLAREVKEIFEEIYRGKEKFPVKRIIGYSWRESLKSLHSTGRAIDINPEENPQISRDGKVLVGKKWEPGINPYSIRPDGDVVRAFTKRGWVWGENFKTKDYMHFGFDEM